MRAKSAPGLRKDVALAPVVEANTTTGTGTIKWLSVRLGGTRKDQKRKFWVTVRVDKDAPRNVTLTFGANTFQTALEDQSSQYCAYGPTNLTVKVKG